MTSNGRPSTSQGLPVSTDGGDTSTFHQHVLENMPGALLVVDHVGNIIYGNRALTQLTGHTLDEGRGTNVMEYIHPLDHEWLIEAFSGVTTSVLEGTAVRGVPVVPESGECAESTPWASVSFRMITAGGDILPVEVTGLSGLHDPTIGGILYDVRPAHNQELMRQVFTGLATSEPVENLLRMVLDMISLPPLKLDAIVLERGDDGAFTPLVTTSPALLELVEKQFGNMPWSGPAPTPQYLDVDDIPNMLGDDLRGLGYQDLWYVSVTSSMMSSTYRIVVCSPERQVPATGTLFRIQRAAELASVVLFRAQADELLRHAANHDGLTGLPNRSGFYSDVVHSMSDNSVAVLYVDIDSLKPVNDQFGHHAGDIVLKAVANRIRSITRVGDHAARLGGDEFAVVLSETGRDGLDLGYAKSVADRLLDAIAKPIDIGGVEVIVSASIGIVVSEEPTQLEHLLSSADAAMYQAKRAGGNQKRVALVG